MKKVPDSIIRYISLSVSLLLIVACNLPAIAKDNETQQQAPISDNNPPVEEDQESVSPIIEDEDDSPDEPVIQTNSEQGLSRSNPYPVGTKIETKYWDIEVLEFHRGEAAWQIIQADSSRHPQPFEGKEYVLVKAKITCKNQDENAHSIYLDELYITGSKHLGYSDGIANAPEPEFYFSDIFNDESREGWIDIILSKDDSNLILAFDKTTEGHRDQRYLALDKNAAVQVPNDISGISPNTEGLDETNPVPIGKTVITEDWEVTILEVARGEDALEILRSGNENASAPEEEGLEFIAFKSRARNISNVEEARIMTQYNYKTFDQAGEELDRARFTFFSSKTNTPMLWQLYFLPGGQREGWIIKMIEISDQKPFTEFIPGNDDFEKRYFSLTP
ncbi:MAG: hypothetical protein JEZ06_05080 [Anaerolineaceae bacterium]|nr:hypothetical protein [Anaerolineaceae bacterium]